MARVEEPRRRLVRRCTVYRRSDRAFRLLLLLQAGAVGVGQHEDPYLGLLSRFAVSLSRCDHDFTVTHTRSHLRSIILIRQCESVWRSGRRTPRVRIQCAAAARCCDRSITPPASAGAIRGLPDLQSPASAQWAAVSPGLYRTSMDGRFGLRAGAG